MKRIFPDMILTTRFDPPDPLNLRSKIT